MSKKKKTALLILCAAIILSAAVSAAILTKIKTVSPESGVFMKTGEPYEFTDSFPYASLDGEKNGDYKNAMNSHIITITAGKSSFDRYTAMLGEKFDLIFYNEIKGNLFAAFDCKDSVLYTSYVPARGLIRISEDSRTDIKALEKFSQSFKYLKRSDVKMAMLDLNYAYGSFGMCYIFTLENGEFIVIDGGYNEGSKETGYDYERIYQYLKKFNPLKFKKPQIAAWILTHEHPDHYNAIHAFAEKHGDDVVVKNFIVNTTPGPYTISFLDKDLAYFGENTSLILPHSGMTLEFAGLKAEFLFTGEDFAEFESGDPDDCNNFSTVIKITVGDQVLLFPADASEAACDIFCPMYGEYLKADIVQIAHHGYSESAATEEFYDLCDPDVVLWPHSYSCYNAWKYSAVNVHLLFKEHVKQVAVADETVKIFTLPYDCTEDVPEEWIVKTDGSKPVKADDSQKGRYIYSAEELF